MRKLAFLLALLLIVSCFAGCGTTSETAIPETPTETEAPAAVAEREKLEDFTVATIDGGSFTLSEALQDHDLVLINLFATWCGPCGREFPYLEEAWQQAKDRVAVIALTVEPDDPDAMLQMYAEDMGISFPIGHEEGTDLGRFVTVGIPTTILVDKNGCVATVEVGAKSSAQAFLDLFDGFSGEEYDPAVCTYTVQTLQTDYQPVAGVVVNFCTDSTCVPVVTDEHGTAEFTGAPMQYHVQVVSLPEGYAVDGDTEFYVEAFSQTVRIYLIPEDA